MKLFAIDEIKGDLTTPGYSKKLKPEFPEEPIQTLLVDTRHFDSWASQNVYSKKIGDIGEQIEGVLFHGDNFHSLGELCKTSYRRQVIDCVYIDPPYNTGDSDGFAYKNTYLQHVSWLTLMARSACVGAKDVDDSDPVRGGHSDLNDFEDW